MPRKLPPTDQTLIPWQSTYARELERRRERAGMSQSELARRATEAGLPLHQTTVARIENGSRSISLNEALVLARILGTDPLAMADYESASEDLLVTTESALRHAQSVARESRVDIAAALTRLSDALDDLQHWRNRLAVAEPDLQKILAGQQSPRGTKEQERAEALSRIDTNWSELQQQLLAYAVDTDGEAED